LAPREYESQVNQTDKIGNVVIAIVTTVTPPDYPLVELEIVPDILAVQGERGCDLTPSFGVETRRLLKEIVAPNPMIARMATSIAQCQFTP